MATQPLGLSEPAYWRANRDAAPRAPICLWQTADGQALFYTTTPQADKRAIAGPARSARNGDSTKEFD
jgi:hypothetical protein